MKKYFYLLTVILSANSCVKIQDSRPASEFFTSVPDKGPAYITPSCSLALNETENDIRDFKLEFTSYKAQVNLYRNTLTFNIDNSNNDILTIKLFPFIARQSTVYDCIESGNLKAYQAFIELYGYRHSPFPSDKQYAQSQKTPATKLHLKYIAATDSYEMTFCNTRFMVERVPGRITPISGHFDFKL